MNIPTELQCFSHMLTLVHAVGEEETGVWRPREDVTHEVTASDPLLGSAFTLHDRPRHVRGCGLHKHTEIHS